VSDGEHDRPAEIAAILLAAGLLGLLAAPITILSDHPDLTSRTGRHLLEGALGMTSLVVVGVLICLIPLRRGEAWAWWAVAIPLFVLGIPIFIVDAMFVPARTRFATLLPQGFGDIFAFALLGYLMWRRRRKIT
jgi:hypothetical protein